MRRNPPTFVAPVFAAARYAAYFMAAMLAHQNWGFVFLLGFCWHTWHALRRAERYIEARVYLKAGLPVPDRSRPLAHIPSSDALKLI